MAKKFKYILTIGENIYTFESNIILFSISKSTVTQGEPSSFAFRIPEYNQEEEEVLSNVYDFINKNMYSGNLTINYIYNNSDKTISLINDKNIKEANLSIDNSQDVIYMFSLMIIFE